MMTIAEPVATSAPGVSLPQPPPPVPHQPRRPLPHKLPPLPEPPPSFTSELVRVDESWRGIGRRLAVGLGLSALYGVALGARAGGVSFVQHAVGTIAAPAAVLALGTPALYILLALFDAPTEPQRVLACAARGTATLGLALAGLAPAAALYAVTSEGLGGASFVAATGLLVAGALFLRNTLGALSDSLRGATFGQRSAASLVVAGFSLFSIALAWRVWSVSLPLFGGAS